MTGHIILCLRLTVPETDESFLKEILERYSDKYIYSSETSKQGVPHFHAVLHVPAIQKIASMRTYISRLCKKRNLPSGNKTFSLTVMKTTEIAAIAYLMKDGKFKSHNYTAMFLKQCSEYDEQVKKEINLKKLSRVARLRQSEDVIYACKTNDHKELLRLITDDFVASDKPFQDHQIVGIYNSLMWLLKPSCRDATISRLYQKINF